MQVPCTCACESRRRGTTKYESPPAVDGEPWKAAPCSGQSAVAQGIDCSGVEAGAAAAGGSLRRRPGRVLAVNLNMRV